MKRLTLLVSIALLSGCASQPTIEKSAQTGSSTKVTASYFEKIMAKNIADWNSSTSCPKSESAIGAASWKRMVNMASSCVKDQDWNRVEQLGNRIAVKAHLTPWGPYFLSLAAESRKDYPRAIWMLELALKKAPNEGILQYELGRIHWQTGDDLAALKYIKSASENNPSLTEAHWIAGMVALNSDKFGEAESAFNRALATQNRHWPSIMALAELKMRTKDFSKAESYLQRAIDLNAQSTKARVALAYVQEIELKKIKEALNAYKDLKRMSASNKLDQPVSFNVDDKIKSIEGAIAKSLKPQVSARQPSAEDGKVAK